jgi:hypothetical protein
MQRGPSADRSVSQGLDRAMGAVTDHTPCGREPLATGRAHDETVS